MEIRSLNIDFNMNMNDNFMPVYIAEEPVDIPLLMI